MKLFIPKSAQVSLYTADLVLEIRSWPCGQMGRAMNRNVYAHGRVQFFA